MALQKVCLTYPEIDIKALTSYVLSRRVEDGGFTFCFPLPSSLPETFYALYMLKYIDVEVDQKTVNFLRSRIRKELYSIHYSFSALNLFKEKLPEMSDFLLHKINEAIDRGKPIDIDFEIGTTASYSFDIPNILREIYLAAYSLRLLGKEVPDRVKDFIENFRRYDGGYGTVSSNLEEIYYCVSILGGEVERKNEVINHILSYECPLGGFNQTPQSYPPYIEETYYALSTLNLLGEEYRNEKTSSYLCSLQNPDGGFRRSIHGGISSLEFSYYVVASLKYISGDFED